MPCTCHSICDNDCGANQICTGHVPVCSNDFTFVNINVGDVVLASHLASLESAINQERVDSGRRFNASEPAYCTTHIFGDLACSNNAFSSYAFSGDRSIEDGIKAVHYDNVKSANNEVVSNSGYGTLVATNFLAQSVDAVNSVILKTHIDDLQDSINSTRNACICDTHCNCDATDCGCDGECPNDDYYYYP